MLLEAAQLFPNDLNIMIEMAIASHRLGLLNESLETSLQIIDRFPLDPKGYESAGRVYRDLSRFEEAEDILLAGRQQCPKALGLAAEYATTADVKGDWNEGLQRWKAIRAAFPQAALGYAGMGATLKRLKRFDEADAVLSDGMARFPRNANLGVNYAWVSDERGDWGESLKRWTALRERFPRDPRVRTGWIECQGKADLARVDLLVESATGESGPAPGDQAPESSTLTRARAPDLQHRDLFMRFESLGENCELGFTQQHFGTEPLGLLRWAGISFDKLLQGLATEFQGVGSAETTELRLNPQNHEYYTIDKVFGLNMHTFIIRDDANEPKIYQKLCRRMQYLRTKLLDDLRSGEKIFVFQSGETLDDEKARRLQGAMHRYGPTKLLVVRLQDDHHAPGTVRVLEDGLMVGYIDRIGYDGKRWAISFEIWRRLCETAAGIVDANASAQGELVRSS